ncbi:CapA family protein [Sutcliffiella cohnii]|uniref:CapA family protein n=1 Tax=Sutcliffiella cohnii TaxID=33932 RepID=UPI002E1E5C70|nr:CapA family protein [Sutcliffiella cohnii]
MKNNWRIILPVLIFLLIGSALLSYILYQQTASSTLPSSNEPQIVHTHGAKSVVSFDRTVTTEVTLSAVGDLLIHDSVYHTAETADGYDFKPMINPVKQFLMETDISIANQETIIGGTEIGLSNYPSFNSPFEVADALLDAGIDIVSIANNHTLDRGERAIMNAIGHYEKIGMQYTGGYKDEEDRDTLRTITKNGLVFSFLSYTYGTNGIPIPQGKDYLVNLIERDRIERDIAHARKHSDIVVVSMHWGVEYVLYPNQEQESLAQFLADAGADIVIGHHPHVLQPMQFIEKKDGGKMFVVYSLGNFLSAQVGNYKDIGGIVQLRIAKTIDKDGSHVNIEVDQFIPTYVSQLRSAKYHIVPLANAGDYGFSNASAKTNEMMDHMFQWINDEQ